MERHAAIHAPAQQQMENVYLKSTDEIEIYTRYRTVRFTRLTLGMLDQKAGCARSSLGGLQAGCGGLDLRISWLTDFKAASTGPPR